MKKLIVTSFLNDKGEKTGVIKPSKKETGFGSVMVILTAITMGADGSIFENKRVAFVRAKMEQLEAMGLKEGDNFNEKLIAWGKSKGLDLKPRTITILETLTEQYPGQAPKINVQTKAPVLSADGSPIYYGTQVPVDDENAKDVIVLTQKAAAALIANTQNAESLTKEAA